MRQKDDLITFSFFEVVKIIVIALAHNLVLLKPSRSISKFITYPNGIYYLPSTVAKSLLFEVSKHPLVG